jgi:hypothetical protein
MNLQKYMQIAILSAGIFFGALNIGTRCVYVKQPKLIRLNSA